MEVSSTEANLFFVLLVIYVSIAPVDCLPDSKGFINIDCGLDANSSFVDTGTTLTYVSDDQFIDTGVNYKIDPQYIPSSLFKPIQTVRSFPSGIRNCYTLSSLTQGSKYLVRGLFMYGNYDKLNKRPVFSIYLGVNFWDKINITTVDDVFGSEIIATATSDYFHVCLINENLGTPFISVLDLRPLDTTIYEYANSTQSLVSDLMRINLGASSLLGYKRYPEDPYDRIWMDYMETTWLSISTISTVEDDSDFATPSIVLQTAATTLSTSQSLNLSWTWDYKVTEFYVILHITEIQDIASTYLRKFEIFAGGESLFNAFTLPKNLYPYWFTYTSQGYNEYTLWLTATSDSILPPILNAAELYIIRSATAAAMNTIKANYRVNKGWSGDPCVPKEHSWTGVTCTSDSNNIPRITALDLSRSGLTGAIIFSFGNLGALKSLDLSYNDLSGDLPAFLDKLSALTYLDITGNGKISTTLPPALQRNSEKKKSSTLIIAAGVGVVVLLLIAASIIIVVCLRSRTYNKLNNQKPKEDNGRTSPAYNQAQKFEYTSETNTSESNVVGENYASAFKPNGGGNKLDLENHRFSYIDLVRITNNFQNNIGTGGFGSVYVGALEDGTQVAVKLRSQTSSQGDKEFRAEAQNLARVHHRNLVSLLGSCMDGDCMALVYEYMPEGTLENKLMDTARPLSWKQRVRIAYESALGLEYLHKACNPPLIHRDVKTSNILLNKNFEARIADFGLSRAFNNAERTHISTAVVGTPGYLDPEYFSSYQLSEKSDVFSFGVVLLEIITGRSPFIAGPEGGHLKQWVNQKLSRGDIESIVDPRMNGQYDINSVWKVAELAQKCTKNSSAHRPTMNIVVTELKESLDLEIPTEGTHGRSMTNNIPHNYLKNGNFVGDASQNSEFEMGYIDSMSAPGPIAR